MLRTVLALALVLYAMAVNVPVSVVKTTEGNKTAATAVDPSVCSLPYVTGFCKGYFPRFFYNPKMDRCEQFIYGGCGGNKNNFEMKADCESMCMA